MNLTKIFTSTTLLITGLMLTASLATADEIIIIHRSGKIDTVPLNDSNDPVEQVSFKRSSQPVSGDTAKTQAAPAAPAPATVQPPKQVEKPPAPPATPVAESSTGKPKIKIRWAEPVDPM